MQERNWYAIIITSDWMIFLGQQEWHLACVKLDAVIPKCYVLGESAQRE